MAKVTFGSATLIHLDGDKTVSLQFSRTPDSATGDVISISGRYRDRDDVLQNAFTGVTHTLTADVSQTKIITLASSVVEDLLEVMTDMTSLDIEYVLYGGGTVTGTGKMVVTAENSAPVYSGATFAEGDTAINDITHGNYFLADISRLTVDTSSATAQNGATIVKRTISLGGQTFVLDGETTSQAGIILSGPGDVQVVTIITDSRGFRTVSTNQYINVQSYKPPEVFSDSVGRPSGAGTNLHITLNGKVSDVVYNGTHVNDSVSVFVRYKKTTDGSYSSVTITPTISSSDHSSFSVDANVSGVSLDENAVYNVRLYVLDRFGHAYYNYVVPKANPVLALRDGKVGVNTASPSCALDVVGNISVTGEVTTASKNSLTTQGIYWVADGSGGYYLIEVMTHGSTIYQRQYSRNGSTTEVYVRSSIDSGANWMSWIQL